MSELDPNASYYGDGGFVVFGRKYLVAASTAVLILGLVEIIVSLIVLRESSGQYIGGWYLGMLCTIAGIRGVRLVGGYTLKWLSVLSFIAWVVSIVGAGIQSASYKFLKDLEACSSYSSGDQNTCFTSDIPGVATNTTGYTCEGNSDYYAAAFACETEWVSDGSDTSDQCSCVSSASQGSCYDYEDIVSCGDLLDNAPRAMHACFAVAILCVIACSVLLALSVTSLRSPHLLASPAELEAADREAALRAQMQPTVVAVATVNPSHSNYVFNPTEVIVVQPVSAGYSSTGSEGGSRAPTIVQGVAVK